MHAPYTDYTMLDIFFVMFTFFVLIQYFLRIGLPIEGFFNGYADIIVPPYTAPKPQKRQLGILLIHLRH